MSQELLAVENINQKISAAIEAVRQLHSIGVYNNTGARVFLGTKEQLSTAWKNKDFGEPSTIGSIGDDAGHTILRFGAIDGKGFVDRSHVAEIMNTLFPENISKSHNVMNSEQVRAALNVRMFETDVDRQESHAELLQKVTDAYNKIYSSNRAGLTDDMFLYSEGITADGEGFDQVSGEIGQFFDAHGIAKSDQLKRLIEILDSGVNATRQFYTAPFQVPQEDRLGMAAAGGTSGGTAYKHGVAVLTGGYKKSLVKDGITHIFINGAVAGILDPLKKAYPRYNFHLLSEQKSVLEDDAQASGL